MKKTNTNAKRVRKYVRAQFAARIQRVNGEMQCAVRNNSARIMIVNPETTLAAMREQLGEPIVENGNTSIFKVSKVGKIALTKSGRNSVLTLVSSK